MRGGEKEEHRRVFVVGLGFFVSFLIVVLFFQCSHVQKIAFPPPSSLFIVLLFVFTD